MLNRDVALLTFKSLSIYVGIRALELFGKMIKAGIGENETEFWVLDIIQMFLPPLILFACALFLWLMAPVLSKRIFPAIEIDKGISLSLDEIQSLVFSAIGLIVLVDGLPDLVKAIIITYVSVAHNSVKELLIERNIIIGTTLMKLGLGFWLLLGNKGLVRVLNREREQKGSGL